MIHAARKEMFTHAAIPETPSHNATLRQTSDIEGSGSVLCVQAGR